MQSNDDEMDQKDPSEQAAGESMMEDKMNMEEMQKKYYENLVNGINLSVYHKLSVFEGEIP
jgi:hypothetical protein